MTMRCWPLLSLLLLWPGELWAEPPVTAAKLASNDDLTAQLKALAGTNPKIARLESLAATRGRNDVWMMELGASESAKRSRRPALLVVAGIEGNDLAGSAIVVAWIERLLKGYESEPSIHELLESTTLYILPRVNPDGAAFFFAKPKVEVPTNSRPIDDDHDGLVDEDGPDDLDGDGWITSMRVKDPAGEYILDPAEPRLLLKADKARGEAGAWRVYSEGLDNDHDESWNEDGPGGVNLNRNFPFNFRFFEPWAGLHQMSEPETRALADFVVAHPNIGIAFTFGAADNLVQTPKSEPGGKKPPGAIQDDDIPFYRELGKAYREALGLKKELTGSSDRKSPPSGTAPACQGTQP